MPILSIFFGIVVRMWHDDHPPPHIHIEYQGFEALVDIKTGEVSQGKLPKKVASIVKEWCHNHQAVKGAEELNFKTVKGTVPFLRSLLVVRLSFSALMLLVRK